MPTQATPCVVYRGVNPPPNPSATTLWLSQSLKTLRLSDGNPDRSVILTGQSGGYEQGICQESNLFWNPVLNNWGMIYGGATAIGYAFCTGAPNIAANWTRYTPGTAVLGGGQGGQTNQALHSRVYIEDTTLYDTFSDPTTNKLRVATASMSAPQTWTTVGDIMSLPSQGVGFGNSIILKRGTNDYILAYEVSFNNASYQIGFATGTSPTGTFTPISQATPSLWPGYTPDSTSGIGGWSPGGPRLFYENGAYILYYHSGALGSVSSDIYRAFSTDLCNWTVDNQNLPFLERKIPLEVSQVADICIVQGPNEGYWATWEAFNNASSTSQILCSPVQEPLMRWDQSSWQPVMQVPGVQPSPDFNWTSYIFTGAHTAQNLDDIAADATAGGFTITLPRADVGARCRIQNIAHSGANVITCAAAGGDTIVASTNTIANGLAFTFRCYVKNYWVRGNG